MKAKNKALLLSMCALLLVAASVFGTLAYLTDTKTVTNTFTVGNIDITLVETKTDFKMVPGNEIAKDPKVTVLKGSEACWLFVKVEKSTSLDTYITWAIAAGWTELTAGSGIYWRSVAADSSNDQPFDVLNGNKVTVKGSVTKGDMDALNPAASPTPVQPTLTFTAYAIQQEGITYTGTTDGAKALEAWTILTTP